MRAPMTNLYVIRPRRAGSTAPLCLIGLAGPASAARNVALATLQAMGYTEAGFADPIYAEVGERWCIDPRAVQPGEGWEVPLPALAIGRCSDPIFRTWCMHRGLLLDQARSPRWTVLHWSLYRRESDPWVFVRQAEAWLLAQHGAGRHHLVLREPHTINEYRLLQHWGARTLEVSARRLPGPLGAHDAWISTSTPEHLAERVATAVCELYGAPALAVGGVQ